MTRPDRDDKPAVATATRSGARWLRAALAAAVMTLSPTLPVAAAADHSSHAAAPGVSRSEHSVALPVLPVVRADGKRMNLAEAIDDGRPVALNFIYTSCNAICPVSSMVFVELREKLGAERDRINMVSISIDPEQDTPRRLRTYANRFGSAGTWAHYTGTSTDAVEIQRAFGAWRGDKMNHQPVTFLRAAGGKRWVRIDGFAAPDVLARELNALRADATVSR